MTALLFTGLSPAAQRDFIVNYKYIPEDHIINTVAKATGVHKLDMQSKGKGRTITDARWMCMYLIRKYTKLTLDKTGYIFNRDHSTVVHGVQTVNDLIKTNRPFREQLQAIESSL